MVERKHKIDDSGSEGKEGYFGFEVLVNNSLKFQQLRGECIVAVKLSLTGITNLVVNYEDPCLVDCFLKSCYKAKDLYNETSDIDAVELQQGRPGMGFAAQYLDSLIFGTIATDPSSDGMTSIPKTDPQTGKRERNPDGFVNRKEVFSGEFKDRLLIIRNVDYCVDFCLRQKPGYIDAGALWIFDNFRNPNVKKGCRILLVTNEPLRFPFKIRTVKFEPVDEFEAKHILDGFSQLYRKGGYRVEFTNTQRLQMIRKLTGLTYTEAGDALGEALSKSEDKAMIEKNDKGHITKRYINSSIAMKNLRKKINSNFMDDAIGLIPLSPKPWEDYICPESSHFTFDVKKIVRDFEEISRLRTESDALIKLNKSEERVSKDMIAIRSRMPHVIVLYGRGGVGKSAFPIHFAGLLDFDVWDFNIGASHSKWVGEGPQRMREALIKIQKATHLVVRIDEYDRAIGSSEASGQGMHEAHKQVEAEFMNWLQNTQEENLLVKNDIFLILTTNHKENITGPLLRSGRADLVIDIADFDAQSMKEAFLTAPRRMDNRGVCIAGFNDIDRFNKAVSHLDLDRLSELATQRGFTVRDIDILLQEMASHNYYFEKGRGGIKWATENFVRVLENSIGSAKTEDTCELRLGDRDLTEDNEIEEDFQEKFAFYDDCSSEFDLDKFVQNSFVEE